MEELRALGRNWGEGGSFDFQMGVPLLPHSAGAEASGRGPEIYKVTNL